MLTAPLPDLDAWTAFFHDADIPVHRSTAAELLVLRENEDDVSAVDIAYVVKNDALLMLKVMKLAAERRSSRMVTECETLVPMLVMMGISPFFRNFERLSFVEDRLARLPIAQHSLAEVLRRSSRAATFALAFAVHRADHAAEAIQEAALLHDFGEMLLWCHAPTLALEVRQREHADPTLRCAAVQRAVLNVELIDVQRQLMQAWRLPELLQQVSDYRQFGHPRVRNVTLAVELARHSARGWDNPALEDDFDEVAKLLNVSADYVQRKVRELDD